MSEADTTGDGSFQIAVSPGDYLVEAAADGVMCTAVDATVPSSGFTWVEVSCDSGVR